MLQIEDLLLHGETSVWALQRRIIAKRLAETLSAGKHGSVTPAERGRLLEALRRSGEKVIGELSLRPGAESLLGYLRAKKIPVGLATLLPPDIATQKLLKAANMPAGAFETVAGPRELLTLQGALGLAGPLKALGPEPRRILVAACSPDLLQAAAAAKARRTFVAGSDESAALSPPVDFQAGGPAALKELVRLHTPLPAGKLPNDLLRAFLDQLVFTDPTLLINPGVGEDIAAIDVGSEEVLVLKSDPITFATDAIGQYLVLVNANDIATSGAAPRWLLTTLMFPCGATPAEIRRVIDDLKRFCQKLEITLCGGHTEITDAVNRPVITGMMAGTVARKDLIDKRQMRTADRILLTKAVAVEGTAIIAREFGSRLKSLGMPAAQITACKGFLDSISIIPEARIAAASPATTAMHDVTEGGIATALEELSTAGRHRLRVYPNRIPVFPETRLIGSLMGIDPLGLIGSGSLLITCSAEGCRELLQALKKAGIQVAQIGEVLEDGVGVEAVVDGQPAEWPTFEVDEIARLF